MKQRKIRLLLAATAVSLSLLAGNPVYAAENPAENVGYEEELRLLFDGEWYASQYPDVVEIYGTDEDALFEHFMSFGINEGRDINTYFDVESYKEANPDLAEFFGDDYAKYYQHYVTFGIDEHRPVKESSVLASAVKSSNGPAENGVTSLASDKVTQNTVDEKAIQEEYERLIIEEGIYGKLTKLRQDKKNLAQKCDDFAKNYIHPDNTFDPSNFTEFNYNAFESNINDYDKLKENSEKNHKVYDEKNEEFKKNFNNILNKAGAIRADEASEAQIKETYNVAISTLELAKVNTLLASDLVDVDNERLKKIVELKKQLDGFKDDAQKELSRSNEDYPLSFGTALYDLKIDTSHISLGEDELELAEKSQFWNEDNVRNYMKKVFINDGDDVRISNYEIYIEEAKRDALFDWNHGRINVGFICDCYNRIGMIIESNEPELKEIRLEYESSAKCQAYKRLSNYFSQELDEYEVLCSEKYKELEVRHQELVDRNTAAYEEFINENVPKEKQEYIDREVITSREKLGNARIEYNSAINNEATVEFIKEEIDEIIAARNIDPSEPTTPDQPDNPGEPTNPDQPYNPGEPTNPDQPDNPGEPTNPDQPDNPSEPTNPNQPDNPGEPTTPDQPDNPGEPTTPDQPDNPGEPTTPDQPDNPGEPTNPDQPDKPGEPTNPDQPDNPGEHTNPDKPDNPGQSETKPKPCCPSTIVIDINGTITVNIVSEIEASIDFDGHFGIKFKP